MSVRLMSAVWSLHFPNTTLKLMALALADFATDDGAVCQSLDTISKRCGMSPSQTQQALHRLRDTGMLRLVCLGNPAHVYRLDLSKLPEGAL